MRLYTFVLALAAAFAGGCAASNVHFLSVASRSGHGDNWSLTWARDDNLYTALCDGMGWASRKEYNTRVYRLRGTLDAFEAEELPSYPEVLVGNNWYGYGMISVDGVLYHFISYLDRTPGASRFLGVKLVLSKDLGATWLNQDGSPMSFSEPRPDNMFRWNSPDNGFTLISVLQAGRDYEDNRDGFVYLYAPNGDSDDRMRELLLARVRKDKITDPAAYEYYVSRKSDGGANWSAEFGKRGVVHQFPANWTAKDLAYSWHPSVIYNKTLGVYVMAAGGTGRNKGLIFNSPSYLGIYTAQNPWGPWVPAYTTENWIDDDDAQTRLYEPVLSPKGISADGKSIYMVYSDAKGWGIGNPWVLPNYKLNVRIIQLELKKPAVSGFATSAGNGARLAASTWLSVYGEDLAAASRAWEARDFEGESPPQSLEGTRVLFNGTAAEVAFVSPSEVKVLSPPGLEPGETHITVETPVGASSPLTVANEEAAPELFSYIDESRNLAVATGSAGDAIGPAGIGGRRPARSGEVVALYGSGFGSGGSVFAGEGVRMPARAEVTMSGSHAEVEFAGAISPGVVQINVRVPDLTRGLHPVVVSTTGVQSKVPVFLAIE